MKPAAYTVTKSEYLHPEAPTAGERYPRFLRKLGLGQPDTKRNFRFWPMRWVYGKRPRQTLSELVRSSQAVLHIGAESGWLTWEMAQWNPDARILAVEPRASLAEWARSHFSERRPEAKVEIVQQKLDDLVLGEEKFDLLVLSFAARRSDKPEAMLERILPSLRPGAQIFYYEGTEPTALNLDRISHWMLRRAKLRGLLTDAWNQRRRLMGHYLDDAVRRGTRSAEMDEGRFYAALQSHFDITGHARRRAFIDLILGDLSKRSLWISLPFYLFCDRLLVASSYLEGCCRVAVGRLKEGAPATGL